MASIKDVLMEKVHFSMPKIIKTEFNVIPQTIFNLVTFLREKFYFFILNLMNGMLKFFRCFAKFSQYFLDDTLI